MSPTIAELLERVPPPEEITRLLKENMRERSALRKLLDVSRKLHAVDVDKAEDAEATAQ